MDFSMNFDGKMTLALLNLKKYREALDDYILAMEKFMKIKGKLQKYVDFENQSLTPSALLLAFDEDEELTNCMLEFNKLIEEIEDKQNKLNNLGKSVMLITNL